PAGFGQRPEAHQAPGRGPNTRTGHRTRNHSGSPRRSAAACRWPRCHSAWFFRFSFSIFSLSIFVLFSFFFSFFWAGSIAGDT
ncbi:MAG TPA: hypothetical protein VJ553_02200, partial [Candidatus Paceibacterota bacterium]|nr:hypothetical protein [Candidatus Paceibacterota bacterium]